MGKGRSCVGRTTRFITMEMTSDVNTILTRLFNHDERCVNTKMRRQNTLFIQVTKVKVLIDKMTLVDTIEPYKLGSGYAQIGT